MPAAPRPATAAPALPAWAPWAGLAVLGSLAIAGAAMLSRRRSQSRRVPNAGFENAPSPLPSPLPSSLGDAASAAMHEPAQDEPLPPLEASRPAPELTTTVSLTQAAGAPLVLSVEATRLSATLVNTTLSYRLLATNAGAEPLTDIAINGDMVSAHASRSMDEQLGLIGPELPPLHNIPTLAPGETLALDGELRLALGAITPIRHGEAQLFVPITRFDAWASKAGGGAVHARAAFLVGQENAASSERLQPFRLDLGPRVYAAIGQRPLVIPG